MLRRVSLPLFLIVPQLLMRRFECPYLFNAFFTYLKIMKCGCIRLNFVEETTGAIHVNFYIAAVSSEMVTFDSPVIPSSFRMLMRNATRPCSSMVLLSVNLSISLRRFDVVPSICFDSTIKIENSPSFFALQQVSICRKDALRDCLYFLFHDWQSVLFKERFLLPSKMQMVFYSQA